MKWKTVYSKRSGILQTHLICCPDTGFTNDHPKAKRDVYKRQVHEVADEIRILKTVIKLLGMGHTAAKFVPHLLTDEQKQI